MAYLFDSSFYGHMELLSDTELTPNQKDLGGSSTLYCYQTLSEILSFTVQSSRASCELLLGVSINLNRSGV